MRQCFTAGSDLPNQRNRQGARMRAGCLFCLFTARQACLFIRVGVAMKCEASAPTALFSYRKSETASSSFQIPDARQSPSPSQIFRRAQMDTQLPPAPSGRFQYDRLDNAKDTIRLLCFAPTTDSDSSDLACRIRSFELPQKGTPGSAPPFVALSYRRGPSSPASSIRLNGARLAVGASQIELLRRVRSLLEGDASLPRHFWIDAICINQDSVRDRNRQVTLIRSIYSTAQHVIVWLGPEADGSDVVMDYVDHNFVGKESASLTRNDETPFNVAQAVGSLLGREYWSRLWIIQELVLGKDALVVCGQKVVPWSGFVSFFKAVDEVDTAKLRWESNGGLPGKARVDAFRRLVLGSPAYTLSSFRAEYWDRKRPPPQTPKIGTSTLSEAVGRLNMAIQKKNALPRHELDVLVDRFGEFGCYDPRDKIYGLLSLVERGPEVDYAKTTERVFKDLLDHMFWVGKAYTTWGDVSRVAVDSEPFYDRVIGYLGVTDSEELRGPFEPRLASSSLPSRRGPQPSRSVSNRRQAPFWDVHRWYLYQDWPSTYPSWGGYKRRDGTNEGTRWGPAWDVEGSGGDNTNRRARFLADEALENGEPLGDNELLDIGHEGRKDSDTIVKASILIPVPDGRFYSFENESCRSVHAHRARHEPGASSSTASDLSYDEGTWPRKPLGQPSHGDAPCGIQPQ